MQLNKIQKNIVFSKPIKYSALRGDGNIDKTTAELHRILYLMNNYCLYVEDKILMVVKNDYELNRVKALYHKCLEENHSSYSTLFASEKKELDIFTMEFLMKEELQSVNVERVSVEEKRLIITQCIIDIKKDNPYVNILKNEYIDFFEEEITWIKACNYSTLEEYQNVIRVGRSYKKGKGPYRLLKASKERSCIYNIYKLYNERLKVKGVLDEEDLVAFLIGKVRKRYTHIIVEDAQNYSRIQLDLLIALNHDKTYSSNFYIIDKDKYTEKNSWFSKGRKLEFKSYTLKKLIMNSENKDFNLDRFKYHDLKHRTIHEFNIDPFDPLEIVVPHEKGDQVFKQVELKALPVFSEIAAGEPIYINEQQENNFFLPEYWLKGMRECFILKVKGDSMIGANIEHGDYVVINKSYSAQNNDIVAVNIDGSATLKRLYINKNTVVLMPENDKYKPIPITEEGASIIGIAAGIIKYQGK
ncbi:MAG: repressor LexA [Clostridiaceae bacterium]|nr:repressor LexA [Clostridiaceae bacterium]